MHEHTPAADVEASFPFRGAQAPLWKPPAAHLLRFWRSLVDSGVGLELRRYDSDPGDAMSDPDNTSLVLPGGPAGYRGETLLAWMALAVAAAICAPALASMPTVWRSVEFYGHGYAIPAVSVYLLWANRERISSAWRDLSPPRLGFLAAFCAAALEVVMIVGDVGFGAQLGIPLVLGAAVYAVGGLSLLRPVLLPLAFLVLMVPPPRFLTYQLLFTLKLFVTDVSVSLLQYAGQTVAAAGNQILIPGHTLFVADACSGLTSIVTLLPLSCIIAYFLSHGAWRRAVIVASVIPLGVGGNLLRVMVTVHMVSTRGIEFSQGLLHESFGLTTYILGTLTLLGVARLLR